MTSRSDQGTPPTLAGFSVAITAARRAEEFSALLTRRGARVVSAAAISMVPLADDRGLLDATRSLIHTPPDLVIATTGIGFRGWIEAADEWGMADDLLAALGSARVISRGPKATGALRAAGLREEWSPVSESSAEVLEYLTADDLAERRVAVQLHGATHSWDPNPGFLDGLTARGGLVVGVPVYRWEGPSDAAAFDALIDDIVHVRVDAVAFTSAPAVASTLLRASELGVRDRLVAAMRGPITAYSVGPVTSAPLDADGVPSVAPDRMRLGALARLMAEDLPAGAPDIAVAGHRLGVHASSAVVDGEVRDVSATGLAVLKALAATPGDVVSRQDLLDLLPAAGEDAHAVEVAVGRLRTALGAREIVGTVVKRGYRLAID
ncbi:uroporphyrinogen-III synthase [Gordonia sp. HY002]|uniref:uroporphyrinogen-III synthase n=1 Tax=Gordonia zhenghanii TaxID=2911516 RepID=UPI001EF09FFF|nr:uroporphyrinogen-III synthase [Gordonia zhenghanii]MCF8569452.1 uroporphyrinogen-III synthase [Gordonia zhenghanii]MCF8602377.1 uroporphyrinogen-III synthase [Gordonia zhenghanii]